MAIYNGPPRGGTRGGKDQFSWDNVKADKDREYYLGHSVKALTGRWQKGKDVYWYTRGKEGQASSLSDELQAVKRREEELMLQALGLKPKTEPQARAPTLEKHELEQLLRPVNDEDAPVDTDEANKGLGYGHLVTTSSAAREVLEGTGLHQPPGEGQGPLGAGPGHSRGGNQLLGQAAVTAAQAKNADVAHLSKEELKLLQDALKARHKGEAKKMKKKQKKDKVQKKKKKKRKKEKANKGEQGTGAKPGYQDLSMHRPTSPANSSSSSSSTSDDEQPAAPTAALNHPRNETLPHRLPNHSNRASRTVALAEKLGGREIAGVDGRHDRKHRSPAGGLNLSAPELGDERNRTRSPQLREGRGEHRRRSQSPNSGHGEHHKRHRSRSPPAHLRRGHINSARTGVRSASRSPVPRRDRESRPGTFAVKQVERDKAGVEGRRDKKHDLMREVWKTSRRHKSRSRSPRMR